MKKKVIAGMMSMALVAGSVMMVSAADTKTENMTVTYNQESTYTVTIPETIPLYADRESEAEIKVSNVNIEPGKILRVKVKDGITIGGQVELTMEENNDVKVVSDVTDGNGNVVSNDTVVAACEGISDAMIEDTTGKLSFSAVRDKESNGSEPVQAGTYNETITFECAIETKTTPTP